MGDSATEVVNEMSYLGVTLKSSGGWSLLKAKQRIKGNQSVIAIDKCLIRTPD
jgi:hypothetical protein